MPQSQNDFQFGKGGIGSNTWEKLDNVIDEKSANKGVLVKNVDNGGSVLLVSTEDKVDEAQEPVKGECFWVFPGQEVFIEINRPDQVRVAGKGEGIDYTWLSY
jgi:hypothetical protein